MTTIPPLADVPIRSADDLTRRWTLLLDPPIFGARSLWLAWIGDDGLMPPLLVPIDDLPELSDPALLRGLRELHAAVTETHLNGRGHLAMALCRPGRPEITNEDDEWAHDFLDLFEEAYADSTWSLHLAAGGSVVPVVDLPA